MQAEMREAKHKCDHGKMRFIDSGDTVLPILDFVLDGNVILTFLWQHEN